MNKLFKEHNALLINILFFLLLGTSIGCSGKTSVSDKAELMCEEHGVPERFCTLCHPDLQTKLMMCQEHGVPEEICTICHPESVEKYGLKKICKEHGLPASLCPKCNPATGAQTKGASESLPLVRLAGKDVAEKAGIVAVTAAYGAVSPVVTANGEVQYDETHMARVRPRVSGVIAEVLVKPGDAVRAGQALATVDSAELGQAKADYLAALPMVELLRKTLARQQGLDSQGAIAGKNVQQSEAELLRAEVELLKASQRLRNFGFNRKEMQELSREDEQRRNEIKILAPLDGTVVRHKAVRGEAVEPATDLFTVADVSQVWINLEIFEQDLRRVRIGQPVEFRIRGLEPTIFAGKVIWIDTEVNSLTRTIRVRAEAENPQGVMRANMFGRGTIQVGDKRTSLVVPREAVQWEGDSHVVFVQTKADQFEPRRVITGQNLGKQIELAKAEIKPGELVVTTGSFLLKTEIQKGSIGAGCCGE
jgi:membrane fusion protein, heavy metal efflux system